MSVRCSAGSVGAVWLRESAYLCHAVCAPHFSCSRKLAPRVICRRYRFASHRLCKRHWTRVGRLLLESTIISHGMPYPDNLATKAVEEVVAAHGATAATIAILDGTCCIGLSSDELERFARLGSDGKVGKVSRRDLAHCVAQGRHGGTTVSCTMLLAHAANIPVFVTGGIGGVHRGGESSMDVSADLCELGRTPVMVVSAGVKSILDIPRTLEYLETQGVCVLALGTDDFPAFFTRHSGVAAPARVENVAQAAAVAHAQHRLRADVWDASRCSDPRGRGGRSWASAGRHRQGACRGRDPGNLRTEITPFLLARVRDSLACASLAANIALIKNNSGGCGHRRRAVEAEAGCTRRSCRRWWRRWRGRRGAL